MKDSSFSKKNITKTMGAVLLAALVTGCMSIPDEVPDDDREIVQLAQTAYDTGHARVALFYYQALLDKFGDNPRMYVEARFETAHIYIKRKRYEEAVPILQELLTLYNNVTPGTLPGEYRKLAQKDLDKVPPKKMAEIERKLAEKKLAEEASASARQDVDVPSDEAVPDDAILPDGGVAEDALLPDESEVVVPPPEPEAATDEAADPEAAPPGDEGQFPPAAADTLESGEGGL